MHATQAFDAHSAPRSVFNHTSKRRDRGTTETYPWRHLSRDHFRFRPRFVNQTRITLLTHFDPDAGDAAVLWSLAVRQQMRHDSWDLRAQLEYLPEDRRQLWAQRIAEAEEKGPEGDNNHNAVAALQCAYIANRRGNDARSVLENALRGGGDTAGVAAIAGQLAGARFGASSVPKEWRDKLWVLPGFAAGDLEEMNFLAWGLPGHTQIGRPFLRLSHPLDIEYYASFTHTSRRSSV